LKTLKNECIHPGTAQATRRAQPRYSGVMIRVICSGVMMVMVVAMS